MDPSLRMARWAAGALAVSALMVAGCATMRVSSFAERGIDLSQYRTYEWAPDDRFATGDPRLDNNVFFQQRLRADVEKQLAAKGFEKSTGDAAALLLHYHASINQQIDIAEADQRYGYTDKRASSLYDAGTILIDFVDARTDKLVWRGWAEGSLDGAIDNQQWMEQAIDKAVTRILEKLPRRL